MQPRSLTRYYTGGGYDRSSLTGTSLDSSVAAPFNPFTTSLSTGEASVGGVPLEGVGGDSIFREVNEQESLSKVTHFHVCLCIAHASIICAQTLLYAYSWY